MSIKARILIVDDDERICHMIKRYLEREGFLIKSCGNAVLAEQLLNSFKPDLVLLDLNLPDGSGLEIARAIRQHSNMGIIVISGTIEQVDKIVSLELGADDFLSKPLNLREILARIRSVLRRISASNEQQASNTDQARTLSFNGWTLDLTSHELTDHEDNVVALTSHEFKLLSLLAGNPNKILSREVILDQLGKRSWSPLDRSIDVMIGKLRKKISGPDKASNPILTIRGEGYKFVIK
jgi:two-component system OmpR family response regulator